MNRPLMTRQTSFGVARLFQQMGYDPLFELVLKSGRRVDVAGLNSKGHILFAEVKSSREDWQADSKWEDYLPFCDAFYFAVPDSFPREILSAEDARPDTTGLIIADRFDGAIVRDAARLDLHVGRRKAVIGRFASQAASRLFGVLDAADSPTGP